METEFYTSDEILATDDLYDIQENGFCRYQLTDDELSWLRFVRGRYSIADVIDENMTAATDIDGNWQYGIVYLESDEISRALDDDCGHYGKAVCLSDDTALQKILFWLYNEYADVDA